MEEMDPADMPADMLLKAAQDKVPVYRITSWEPIEISLVSIPADVTVGVGRELTNDPPIKPEGVRTMPELTAAPATAAAPSPELSAEALARMEQERVQQIKTIA